MADVPAGFEPIFRLSEFTELIGPIIAVAMSTVSGSACTSRRSMPFARCAFHAGEQLLARATGVFKDTGEVLQSYQGENHE